MKYEIINSMTDNQGWWYNGSQEIVVPEWAVGMVYVIEHIPDDAVKGLSVPYVGKKLLTSTKRSKIGVREKTATKTRKTYKVVKKNSGWENYWGSSKSLHAARETGEGTWKRTIIEWCYSKKNMTYTELKYQLLLGVLERESYNDNINGSIYRTDCNKELWEAHKEKMKNTPRVRKPKVKKEIL